VYGGALNFLVFVFCYQKKNGIMNTIKDNPSWRLTSDQNKLKQPAHSQLKCERLTRNYPRRRSDLWKTKQKQLTPCRIRRKLTIKIRILDMHLIKSTPINIILNKRSSRCSEMKRYSYIFIIGRRVCNALVSFLFSPLTFSLKINASLIGTF